MNNIHHNPHQEGFALLPVLVVVLVVLSIGSGVTIYQVQRHSQQEKEELVSRIEALEGQVEATSTPTLGEAEPTPSAEPTDALEPSPSPAVKAATTSVPAKTAPKSAEASVPQIVVEEYKKVFGRDPGISDIDYWKGQYRKYGWSREQLHANLVAASKREVERQDVDVLTAGGESEKARCERLALKAKSDYSSRELERIRNEAQELLRQYNEKAARLSEMSSDASQITLDNYPEYNRLYNEAQSLKAQIEAKRQQEKDLLTGGYGSLVYDRELSRCLN